MLSFFFFSFGLGAKPFRSRLLLILAFSICLANRRTQKRLSFLYSQTLTTTFRIVDRLRSTHQSPTKLENPSQIVLFLLKSSHPFRETVFAADF